MLPNLTDKFFTCSKHVFNLYRFKFHKGIIIPFISLIKQIGIKPYIVSHATLTWMVLCALAVLPILFLPVYVDLLPPGCRNSR